MAQGGRLIFTLILQCSALSLANQNLVPIFISEIGKPFISLRSEIKAPWQFQREEPWERDCERATSFPGFFFFEIGRGGKSFRDEVCPFDWNLT